MEGPTGMMSKIAIGIALWLAATGAWAAETFEPEVQNVPFSFEGLTGTYDEHQLQRGLQVYTEVCSACHGMKFVPFRTLGDEGGPHLPADQVRAYAANFEVFDKDLDATRPALPVDHYPPSSYPGAPDLSLMAKARAGFEGPYGLGTSQLVNGIGGPEHIYSILNGYTGETKDEAGVTYYQNTAFSTGWIAMPPPLSDGAVEFADGSDNSMHGMTMDVASFLMWTAEPKLMARKQAGLTAIVFLAVLSVLLYLTNKRVWAKFKGPRRTA